MILTILYLIIKFAFSIATMIVTLYMSSHLFDKWTKEIEEWKEVRKGNVAGAIYFSSVLLAISFFIFAALEKLHLYPGQSITTILKNLILDLGAVILAAVLGTFTVYVTIKLLDSMTEDIDEWKELKKGNIAVALMISIVILTVSLIAAGVVDDIIETIMLDLTVKL